MPSKIFVDTNVILKTTFMPEDYLLVRTSIITVEEIDGLKKSELIGYQARDATKKLKSATNVDIMIDYEFPLENRFLEHKNDNFILGFAMQAWQDDNESIFLTMILIYI